MTFRRVKEEKRVCLVAPVKNKTLPFHVHNSHRTRNIVSAVKIKLRGKPNDVHLSARISRVPEITLPDPESKCSSLLIGPHVRGSPSCLAGLKMRAMNDAGEKVKLPSAWRVGGRGTLQFFTRKARRTVSNFSSCPCRNVALFAYTRRGSLIFLPRQRNDSILCRVNDTAA